MTRPFTLGAAVDHAGRVLAAAGVSVPRLEARLILAHVLGIGAEAIIGHPERELSARQRTAFTDIVDRRKGREPLAYILGRREFWSLSIFVNRHTLIPRPESETLVETTLRRIGRDRAGLRILDLGTGSGCLLLAVLSELPEATGLGVDRSWSALQVAQRNAKALGLAERTRFVCGDWATGVAGGFDLVVANPPYVAVRDIATLAPDITRYEPRMALDGGDDGLRAYCAIAPDLPRVLAPEGMVILEVGAGQAAAVAALLRRAGFQRLEINSDLSGVPRCVSGFLGQNRDEKNGWKPIVSRLVSPRRAVLGSPDAAPEGADNRANSPCCRRTGRESAHGAGC